MRRRGFLRAIGATGLAAVASSVALVGGQVPARALVLVRLKGGNDGLNSVIPYADPAYYRLRPTLAVRRDVILQLDHRLGLHPALAPLMPLWQRGEMAILQGVGYPDPSLSHFRSTEIWDSACDSPRYLPAGWLTRALSRDGRPWRVSDGGPSYIEIDQPPCDLAPRVGRRPGARAELHPAGPPLRTTFPIGAFGRCARAACLALAADPRIQAIRLELDGFDTHQNQASRHAAVLGELAEGLIALRAGLKELRLWESTLVLTQSEFGRRIAENLAAGTDHGTAAVHFALGARVHGGLYGKSIELANLDGNGNPEFSLDFRAVYATVLERWIGRPAFSILGRRFGTENFLGA